MGRCLRMVQGERRRWQRQESWRGSDRTHDQARRGRCGEQWLIIDRLIQSRPEAAHTRSSTGALSAAPAPSLPSCPTCADWPRPRAVPPLLEIGTAPAQAPRLARCGSRAQPSCNQIPLAALCYDASGQQRRVTMKLRRLIREDWAWIQDWFKDPQLNQELGPLDQEWLDAVMNEDNGIQLVAIEDNQPVALIGCAWHPAPHELHGITDIAVSPAYKKQGLGRNALYETIKWSGHPPCSGWVAFVSPQNAEAEAFFSSVGWKYTGLDDEMHRFELRNEL
ncbi:RimJ/RimL family protein N-acetyltransferase [Pseudomonas protegens]